MATRALALQRLAEKIEDSAEEIVSLLVQELEMTVTCARSREVELPAMFLREHGPARLDRWLSQPELALARRRALGRVAIILPYNAIGIAAAATVGAAYLMGNDVLVRLPSRVPQLSALYQRLIESTLSGVEVVTEPGPNFLARCFTDESIKAVCLFGDDRWFVPYGQASQRGAPGPNFRELARRTRTKVIFEGPGKDPFIVFSDADIDKAATGAVASAYVNAGQSCSSPERFFVHASVHDAFVEAALERARNVRLGSPADRETQLGPIGSAAVRERIQAQFADARERGARFLLGGEFARVPGCRSPVCLPTVVTNCDDEMLLFREETFGPVIPIIAFDSEEQLDALVNDTQYGLTATVYGGDVKARASLANAYGRVFHDSCIVDPEHALCRLFWGGFRNSGWIWEWVGPSFVHREGPRRLIEEFSWID